MRELKNAFWFILSAAIVGFSVIACGMDSYSEEIVKVDKTELVKVDFETGNRCIEEVYLEPETRCIVGWLIDGKNYTHPDFQSLGYPEYIVIEKVKIPETSTVVNYLKNHCTIQLP